MIFLKLSTSQLSRDEMRSVIGGSDKLIHEEADSCHSYCDSTPCKIGCRCIHLHGHDRCYT
jgi:hypothetical protein